jgi:hypothetical protein
MKGGKDVSDKSRIKNIKYFFKSFAIKKSVFLARAIVVSQNLTVSTFISN